jgi:hypothetical protein
MAKRCHLENLRPKDDTFLPFENHAKIEIRCGQKDVTFGQAGFVKCVCNDSKNTKIAITAT